MPSLYIALCHPWMQYSMVSPSFLLFTRKKSWKMAGVRKSNMAWVAGSNVIILESPRPCVDESPNVVRILKSGKPFWKVAFSPLPVAEKNLRFSKKICCVNSPLVLNLPALCTHSSVSDSSNLSCLDSLQEALADIPASVPPWRPTNHLPCNP